MDGVCAEGDDCSIPRKKVATTEDFIYFPQNSAALAVAIAADLVSAGAVDSNGQLRDHLTTILPPEVLLTGATSSITAAQARACCMGINVNLNTGNTDFTQDPKLCIQSVNVSTDFNREDVLCLGQKGPKTRTITPPVSVTTAIEVTSENGAQINALQNGVIQNCTSTDARCKQAGLNLKNQTIRLVSCDGTYLYMGTKNKLQSVSTTGGSTDGDNLTVTYTYQTFNTMTVIHEDEGRCNANSVLGTTPWLTETVAPGPAVGSGEYTPTAEYLTEDTGTPIVIPIIAASTESLVKTKATVKVNKETYSEGK